MRCVSGHITGPQRHTEVKGGQLDLTAKINSSWSLLTRRLKPLIQIISHFKYSYIIDDQYDAPALSYGKFQRPGSGRFSGHDQAQQVDTNVQAEA